MSATDLTSLANVKTWLGKTDASSDPILSLLIPQISDEIRTYTNRDIYPVTNYGETRDGNGRSAMTVLQYPIASVTGVTINGVPIPALSTPTGLGYGYDKNSIRLQGYVFTKGVQNVSIAYSAGYAVLPPVIERACIELIAHRFEGKNRVGVKSKSQGAQNVTFDTSALPESVATILKQWGRPYPG